MNLKLDFIGIGAARSGTTWLTDCLSAHPKIFIPRIKEIAFFNQKIHDKNYLKGFEWYESFFKNAPKDSVKGEFSTHYMLYEDASILIKKHFPNIKLIACLRNPADMLYSFYWWRKSTFDVNKIPDTFEEAIKVDPEYKTRGLYYQQLRPYFELFDKNKIKIILFDDIKNTPGVVLKDVYNFLNVDSLFRPKFLSKRINYAKKARSRSLSLIIEYLVNMARKLGINTYLRSMTRLQIIGEMYNSMTTKNFCYPEMKAETRKKISQMVDRDIERLENLLGRDLSMWRE